MPVLARIPQPGVGAWRQPVTYQRLMKFPTDTFHAHRVHLAVMAFQRALIATGYLTADPLTLDGVIGPKTDKAIRQVQTDNKLTVDGQIGPRTSNAIFWPIYKAVQRALNIPQNFLYGQGKLESGFDPGAEGSYDRDDRGIAQYNRHWHPEISDDTAFGDAIWCIKLDGRTLAENFVKFRRWDASIAYHNNPSLATKWAQTGAAPTAQIADYVDKVFAAAKTAAP